MKSGVNLIITAVLTLGILGVLNFFASRHFVRYDMTENQDYTLSEATKRILRNIEDEVTIKIYLTVDPPTRILDLKRRIEDTVSEFRAAGRGKLRIDYIDPKADDAEMEKARKWGIRPLTVQVRKQDSFEQVQAYFGMAILYEDKREVIPIIANTQSLEYDMISSIKKLTLYATDDLPQIAFLGGHGEPGVQYGEYRGLGQITKKIVHVTTVNPSLPNSKGISNEENAVLVVARPVELAETDLYAIDQFLMKGGKIIFLLDPIQIDNSRGGTTAKDTNSNLDEMLAHYGVGVNHDLVMDDPRYVGKIPRQRGPFQFREPYPFFIAPTANNLSQESPVTASLDQMILPWASSLVPIEDNLKDREVIELAWTSDNAWTMDEEFDVTPPASPRDYPRGPDGRIGKRIVALAVTGKFTSFFKDKEIPVFIDRATGEPVPVQDGPLPDRVDQVESSQIIVVGDSGFLESQALRVPGNANFFLNAIEWLALNPELVTIRGKGEISRPLDPKLGKELKARKNRFKIFNLIGIPLVVAGLGLLRFLFRRLSRRRYMRAWASARPTKSPGGPSPTPGGTGKEVKKE
ncbi:MAG: GldG family protein [Planctomycetota bacterium]|nr:GldG family protein [Planctomycetota bacterium]